MISPQQLLDIFCVVIFQDLHDKQLRLQNSLIMADISGCFLSMVLSGSIKRTDFVFDWIKAMHQCPIKFPPALGICKMNAFFCATVFFMVCVGSSDIEIILFPLLINFEYVLLVFAYLSKSMFNVMKISFLKDPILLVSFKKTCRHLWKETYSSIEIKLSK